MKKLEFEDIRETQKFLRARAKTAQWQKDRDELEKACSYFDQLISVIQNMDKQLKQYDQFHDEAFAMAGALMDGKLKPSFTSILKGIIVRTRKRADKQLGNATEDETNF